MKKLISMVDFVLEQSESIKSDMIGYGEFIDKVVKYANFLKTPLTLGMFVPCDEDGNVLEEPREDDYSFYTHNNKSVHEEYNEAKERVLFCWSEHIDAVKHHISQGRTIEYLANFGDIELTPSALKQIGLNS